MHTHGTGVYSSGMSGTGLRRAVLLILGFDSRCSVAERCRGVAVGRDLLPLAISYAILDSRY